MSINEGKKLLDSWNLANQRLAYCYLRRYMGHNEAYDFSVDVMLEISKKGVRPLSKAYIEATAGYYVKAQKERKQAQFEASVELFIDIDSIGNMCDISIEGHDET